MATTKNENKVNNVKANANNVNNNNESAATATAKVENESATMETMENVENVENVENESKQEATATEPTAEQIAAAKVETKHQTEIEDRYTLEAPTEVEKTKFAGATVLGVWRAPKDVKKNGDKTFFKIFYNGQIYDGFTSTEFCDAVGIERKHRNGSNTPKVTTLLDKLQALKNAIEAIGSTESDFVNFAKIVASKIESEKLESDRSAFVAKYSAAIPYFAKLSESDFEEENGKDELTLALKLGYKFKDTKATDKATETTESDKSDKSESESK